MRRRVVITGLGMINPMGHDAETVWAGLKEGRSGVGYTTVFDASSFPTRISSEVKNWDVSHVGEDPETWKSCGRHTKFAVGAAKQ
nr:beta-ketoacyl-[acyl-carrier-protein] synthase II [Pirellulaceae bacterium]